MLFYFFFFKSNWKFLKYSNKISSFIFLIFTIGNGEATNELLINWLKDCLNLLKPLNQLSRYWFHSGHYFCESQLQQKVNICQQNYLLHQKVLKYYSQQTQSGLRNKEEFERERKIENLNLDKDDKYLELLKPYRYERREEGGDFLHKVAYKYICKYNNCDKNFTKAWNFLDHVRMHEGIKPYQCNNCEKEFVQKCNLKKHFRRHLSETLEERKVFKCSVCRKGFTERYNLKVRIFPFFLLIAYELFIFYY